MADVPTGPRPKPSPRRPPNRQAPPKRSGMNDAPAATATKVATKAKRPVAKKATKPRRKRTSWRVWLRRMTFGVILVGVGTVGGGFVVLNNVEVPDPVREMTTTSFVCTSEVPDNQCTPSNSVAQFSSGGNRIIIGLDEVSPHLINAVVAGEDRSFFDHGGVDPWGIARALYRDVRGSASTQGGSTITQQYVKNVYLNSDRTPERKLKEAAISIQLERQLTKPEILERYLNEVYFGRGANGVEAAARAYFGKDAKTLDIAESAYLAGLIRAPKYADATKTPEQATEAKRRRKTVLNAMVEEKYITPDEAKAADETPFEGTVLVSPRPNNGTDVREAFSGMGGEYIIEWVRTQLNAMPNVGEDAVYSDGLRIYLTVNPVLQQTARDAISEKLTKPEDPAAAMVSVDDGGRIVSLIGGQDYETQKVNLALGKAGGGSGRSPGSTFKPIALAEYVAEGNSVKSKFWAPAAWIFPTPDAPEPFWPVHNYEEKDLGQLTVEDATWKSANTAYAQIMNQITPKNFAAMAAKLGVTAPVNEVPSSVLGTSEVSVLDVTTAYSTFANHGTLKRPYILRRVEDSDGEVLYDVTQDPAYAPVPNSVDPAVADTVASTLTGVIQKGTGQRAKIKQQAAGKTGTTDDYKDAWFAGFTCRLTTVVWMGHITGEPGQPVPVMDKVTGGSTPAEIWQRYMSVATDGSKGCSFKPTDAGTVLGDNLDLAPTTTLPPVTPVTLPDGTPAPPVDPAAPTTAGPPTTAPGAPTTAPSA